MASSMVILWEGHRLPAGNASGSQDPPVGGQGEGVALADAAPTGTRPRHCHLRRRCMHAGERNKKQGWRRGSRVHSYKFVGSGLDLVVGAQA